MALVYARGLKSKDAVKKAGESREKNMRVIGSGKPNTGGSSSGGSGKSVKLSAQERSVAKAAGWSDKEYTRYEIRRTEMKNRPPLRTGSSSSIT